MHLNDVKSFYRNVAKVIISILTYLGKELAF